MKKAIECVDRGAGGCLSDSIRLVAKTNRNRWSHPPGQQTGLGNSWSIATRNSRGAQRAWDGAGDFRALARPTALFRYLLPRWERGLEVIIAAAGGAAHLPGVCAAEAPFLLCRSLPRNRIAQGLVYLSIVQMPPRGGGSLSERWPLAGQGRSMRLCLAGFFFVHPWLLIPAPSPGYDAFGRTRRPGARGSELKLSEPPPLRRDLCVRDGIPGQIGRANKRHQIRMRREPSSFSPGAGQRGRRGRAEELLPNPPNGLLSPTLSALWEERERSSHSHSTIPVK